MASPAHKTGSLSLDDLLLMPDRPLSLVQAIPHTNESSAIVKIYSALKDIANRNSEIFEGASSRELSGDALINACLEAGIKQEILASILYIVYNKQPKEVLESLSSQDLSLKSPGSTANYIKHGSNSMAAKLGITDKINFTNLWDHARQERTREIVRHIQDWAVNPHIKTVPKDAIILPIPCLIQNIPWLDGREDQLLLRFREVSSNLGLGGKPSSTTIHANFELRSNGLLTLTLSLAPDSTESQRSVPHSRILSEYLIGAAWKGNGQRKNDRDSIYTKAKLLLSRKDASERLKQIYPRINKKTRIIQESLLMLADGAIDLKEFEAPRHLKVVRTKVKNKDEAKQKISETACLTVISNITVTRANRITGLAEDRPCKSIVGLSSRQTLQLGYVNCSIKLTDETAKTIASTGSFVGASFKLIGGGPKATDSHSEIGNLVFISRENDQIPRFAFEADLAERNNVQASKWGNQALEWLSSNKARKPIGHIIISPFHYKNKNSSQCIIGGKDFILREFPRKISKLIVCPAQVKINGRDIKFILLFGEDAQVYAAICMSELPNKKGPYGFTPTHDFSPIPGIQSEWRIITQKGNEAWRALRIGRNLEVY